MGPAVCLAVETQRQSAPQLDGALGTSCAAQLDELARPRGTSGRARGGAAVPRQAARPRASKTRTCPAVPSGHPGILAAVLRKTDAALRPSLGWQGLWTQPVAPPRKQPHSPLQGPPSSRLLGLQRLLTKLPARLASLGGTSGKAHIAVARAPRTRSRKSDRKARAKARFGCGSISRTPRCLAPLPRPRPRPHPHSSRHRCRLWPHPPRILLSQRGMAARRHKPSVPSMPRPPPVKNPARLSCALGCPRWFARRPRWAAVGRNGCAASSLCECRHLHSFAIHPRTL